MKIGILTFHRALNVGAVLQAYALQQYLANLGHSVEFIDYAPRGSRASIRGIVGRGLLKTLDKWEDIYFSSYYSKKRRFNSMLRVGERSYEHLAELREDPPDSDVYIAGSDQIWNFGPFRPFDEAFFLSFGGTDVARIAFAASIGQSEIDPTHGPAFAQNLKRFNSLSVREEKSTKLLSELIGGEAAVRQVCDPTFLLPIEGYDNIIAEPKEDNDYLASYVLPHGLMPPDLIKAVYYIEEIAGLKLINLRNPNTCLRFRRAKNQVVCPREWLGYFKHASLTVCCSFHAVVFSLLYHKPFVVVSPYLNDRIVSLLSPLGLADRCIYSFDPAAIRGVLSSPIDWSTVDDALGQMRNKAVDFLNTSLALG